MPSRPTRDNGEISSNQGALAANPGSLIEAGVDNVTIIRQ